MSQFKKVEYKNKIHYNPPFINDDPLVVDKGNPHFNHDGKKDFIQSIESYKYENGTLTFNAETWRGKTALIVITFVSDTAYRLQMFPYSKVPEKMYPVYDFAAAAVASVEESEDFITAKTARLTLTIRKNPWEVVTALDGEEITREQIQDFNVDQRYKGVPLGFSFDGDKVTDCFETMYLHCDESFYGFGEKFTGFDKRGQKITTWQRDAQSCESDISYKGQPFFTSSYGYAILLNSFTRNHFNMGATSGISYNMEVEDPYIDYYMFCNRDYKGLIYDYTALAGRAPMLPKFSFGYWQSKMVYNSRAEINAVIEKFKELDLPLDTVHLDGTVWNDISSPELYAWGNDNFPDFENYIKGLKEKGIHVSAWLYPYVSHMTDFGTFNTGDGPEIRINPAFVNMEQKGWLVKNRDGKTYLFSPGEGDPNNNGVAALDFTNPDCAAYVKDRLKKVIKTGIAIIKTDFGEEIPADAVFFDGTTGVQSHNKYTYLYAKLYYEACAEAKKEMADGEPAMLWGRSGYTGNHVNPANWAGDSSGSLSTGYALLNAGLSMAMCAVPFWGYDVGGFYSSDFIGNRAKPTDYEYVRSAQMGLLLPLCRSHAQATDREPWTFSDAALAEFRKMQTIRYSLVPYLYSTAYDAHNYGYPIMRPMLMEFQDDYATKALSGQYMLGDALLVAPVFDQKVHHIYLPRGVWSDFYTGERTVGGRWITSDIKYDKIPVFVRENHAVYMTLDRYVHIPNEKFKNINLVLNLKDRAEGTYSDDGVNGSFTAVVKGGVLTVEVKDIDLKQISVSCGEKIYSCTVNGEKWTVEPKEHYYKISE